MMIVQGKIAITAVKQMLCRERQGHGGVEAWCLYVTIEQPVAKRRLPFDKLRANCMAL
jgi:hypothetical protein